MTLYIILIFSAICVGMAISVKAFGTGGKRKRIFQEIMVENEDGTTYPKRVFEMARSQRLHWINHHVRELTPDNLDVFTIEERDGKKRKVKKTYIYDKVEKYVIVLEQQRSNGFYLLTAYHLNKEYGLKALEKKMKKRLQTPL